MDRDYLGHLALSIALTATAGFVDAVGFLKVGHLFVSFMSGDSTQFAVAGSHAAWGEARSAGVIIALFVLGVIAGRLIGEWTRPWNRPAVLAIESALLGCTALAGLGGRSPILLMTCAMGIQNAAVHRAGGTKMSLTYVTGTLVSFGESVADALRVPPLRRVRKWLPYLLLWVGLVMGAGGGAVAYRALLLKALLIPAGALLLMAAINAAFIRHDCEAATFR